MIIAGEHNLGIKCIHCDNMIKIPPRTKEGHILLCYKCKGITPFQGVRATKIRLKK